MKHALDLTTTLRDDTIESKKLEKNKLIWKVKEETQHLHELPCSN